MGAKRFLWLKVFENMMLRAWMVGRKRPSEKITYWSALWYSSSPNVIRLGGAGGTCAGEEKRLKGFGGATWREGTTWKTLGMNWR